MHGQTQIKFKQSKSQNKGNTQNTVKTR
jgi:hypothetical protein